MDVCLVAEIILNRELTRLVEVLAVNMLPIVVDDERMSNARSLKLPFASERARQTGITRLTVKEMTGIGKELGGGICVKYASNDTSLEYKSTAWRAGY